MTLQDIVTCKETSQKLAEVGLPQEEGVAYWFPYVVIEDDPNSINRAGIKVTDKQVWHPVLAETEMKSKTGKMVLENAIKEGTIYRAWSFSELWDLLPNRIKYTKRWKKDIYFYDKVIAYDETDDIWLFVLGYYYEIYNLITVAISIRNKLPHEAAAELLLWCVKEGYLNATK